MKNEYFAFTISCYNEFFLLSQVKWHNALIENDKAVQKYRFPKEIYVKYYHLRRAGNPDYDLLVQ